MILKVPITPLPESWNNLYVFSSWIDSFWWRRRIYLVEMGDIHSQRWIRQNIEGRNKNGAIVFVKWKSTATWTRTRKDQSHQNRDLPDSRIYYWRHSAWELRAMATVTRSWRAKLILNGYINWAGWSERKFQDRAWNLPGWGLIAVVGTSSARTTASSLQFVRSLWA